MPPNARRALASEAFAIGELAGLHADPIYYGVGAPRGDRRYVVVLPGLFANDVYLTPLREWLRRIGYTPVRSTMRANVGCLERLSREVEASLQAKLESHDRPVAFIGHSRGGVIARAMAARLGKRASHLILLGSPVGFLSRARVGLGPEGRAASQVVFDAGQRSRQRRDPQCEFPVCGCPFPRDAEKALHASTAVVSIYSKDDPIVPPAACRVKGAKHIEVSGTHSGLVYNGAAYRAIAKALAAR